MEQHNRRNIQRCHLLWRSVYGYGLGLSSSFSQAQALPIRHYVNETLSVYVDDNWKVTPRLSLQLGLRYDALPHAWERGNNVSNFDPNLYLSSQAPSYIASNTPAPSPVRWTRPGRALPR